MNDWIEVNVAVTHEAVEAVSDILTEAGSKGVAIEDPQLINELRSSGTWELCDIPEQQNTEVVTVSGYYADDDKLQRRLAQIEAALQEVEKRIGKYRFSNTRFRRVSEQDWANEWKQYFHVTHVGKSLVIKPSWEEYEPEAGEHVIEIDPGMAFGTGTHHTTNMMMERLERVLPKDAVVFDVGTGSGILAIAAALCGAKEVKAVDIDGVAVRVARENVADNHLSDKIEVREGDLLHGTEGTADVIIANIIADIIILLLKDVPGKLKDGGLFLASGIIEERMADVAAEAERQGMQVDAVDRRGGWVVMQMRKR
ncbi:50S ribosomal protein L11 methyltransferase [uncultured Phascolarctobacterium sp.]|uniref:50S ribosomal protein L11 methyltransferase n=1 Tax=uncultured Phascolarctobacterium sp. TaxID=512296 RepID=UPI0025EAD480|nr:50S ribosomal protein L11 methyltransferase [uncultured Phascolarctobacterium sp.]